MINKSYDIEALPDMQVEIERLRLQAKVLWSQERHFLLEAGLKPEYKVADIGCGSGVITAQITELLTTGEVVGIDVNPQLLTIAQMLAQQTAKMNICSGNVYSLHNIADNSFDFVYARLIFQHLDQPLLALKEIYRILKPGGTVLIQDIDDGWIKLYPEPPELRKLMVIANQLQAKRGGDRTVGRKLVQYLSEAGFMKIKCTLHSLTTMTIGLEMFLKMISCFQSILSLEGSLFDSKGQSLFDTIQGFAHSNKSLGYVSTFFVHGYKE
jgi:ubiquinone/menaquinone biosynthesis C-methylase UbiE